MNKEIAETKSKNDAKFENIKLIQNNIDVYFSLIQMFNAHMNLLNYGKNKIYNSQSENTKIDIDTLNKHLENCKIIENSLVSINIIRKLLLKSRIKNGKNIQIYPQF